VELSATPLQDRIIETRVDRVIYGYGHALQSSGRSALSLGFVCSQAAAD
jgi:hypothetical protein